MIRVSQHFILVAVVLFLVFGCSKSSSRRTGALAAKITLDGKADDWADVAPLWTEGGLPGRGDFNGLDIKQVYFTNDREYLYIFFRTSPTVQERFDEEQTSGGFCELYFDTDNNAATGCKGVIGFKYGEINGYELNLWMPLGLGIDPGGSYPFMSYEVQKPGDDGGFVLGSGQFGQNSHRDGSLIAHGPDGVELAVPLKELSLQPGASIRILLRENAHTFEKGGYTQGTLILN